MDAVKSFNAELSALYEVKPPISKAKMTAITRGAIKAIKFYKHVVQSVEKFILKCKPEYKVPGLYVIDSIVRQSRHQFGSDKDVFAPRFAKNMQQTFVNLFKCPPEEKSKIIRVLNLWQKNQVFAPEVIQPLFDLTDPNNPIHKELGSAMQQQSNGMSQGASKGSPATQKTPTKGSQPQGSEAHGAPNLNLTDPAILAQIQKFFHRGPDGLGKAEGQVHFDKKLLDYDYGDDEEEVNPSPRPPQDSVASLLANPEVIKHLQTIQQGMQTGHAEMDVDTIRKLQEMKQQEDEFDKHLAQTLPNLPFAAECEFKPGGNAGVMGAMAGYYMAPEMPLLLPPPGFSKPTEYDGPQPSDNGDYSSSVPVVSTDMEVIMLDQEDSRSPSQDRYRDRRRRSRSRDKSRDRARDRDRDRRRRSRDRSRSRGRRHRSKSRERNRREKEKEESEQDIERKKRGLPVIKKENLSVCSTTLWVGHLSKLVHQEDLSNTFGEFGEVVSIDLIPPRGCAFIVMHRRQDAARCLNKLKNYVLHGKAITLAWAPGKGLKGKDLKDYWEVDLGVSYIPWSKIKQDIDLEMLEDGGMIDEDTMPGWMKDKMSAMTANRAAFMQMGGEFTPSNASVDTSQPPPIPGAAGLLQSSLALSLMPQFQFNNRLLGGPVGMPGMMPNIPMGVPPPNMPTPMLSNPLLGLSSPFQGPPGLISQVNMNEKGPPGFGMIPTSAPMGSHDDNMDVEMEDAEREMEMRTPLLADPMGGMMPFGGDKRDNGRDDRGRRRSRSRDRGRGGRRSRDREMEGRRDSREGRNNGRNDRNNDRRRDERRDRPNRWSEREAAGPRPRDPDPEVRKDREKTLNERLQEMAGMTETRNPERVEPPGGALLPNPVDRESPGVEPPPNMTIFPPRGSCDSGGGDFGGGNGPPDFGPPMPLMRGPPMDDFDGRMNGPPDMMDGPPRLMDGPPHMGPPQWMHHDDGFRRGGGGRRGDFRDDFDRPMRGHHPDDYFDDFGPRGPPMMRGGHHDFGPRGPPMMRGEFGPRGPRFGGGPRGGHHMRARGPRFDNYRGRMDGPPDFYRGPRGGPPPPGMYDEPPHHMRKRGGGHFDDRRRGPPGGHHRMEMLHEDERNERRSSRWGNDTPTVDEGSREEHVMIEEVKEDANRSATPLEDEFPPVNKVQQQQPVVEEPPEAEGGDALPGGDDVVEPEAD